MPALAATQIPKPADEKAFERCNRTLWKCILDDEGVQLHGRSGQEQFGVDLHGLRDGNPDQIVGVQCKLKGDGKKFTRKELKDEVRKALKFKPALTEYYIVTTAPDDGDLQRRALRYSSCLSKNRARPIKIRVWGWGSVEQEILRFPRALKEFDPSHTPHGDRMLQQSSEFQDEFISKFTPILRAELRAVQPVPAADSHDADSAVQSAHDSEIDRYRDMVETDPKTALGLLRSLGNALDASVSGRIRFRVEANVAACQLQLGDTEEAAAGLIAAYDHDPENPKAIANKALGLWLQEDWSALRTFAEAGLHAAPDNAALAAYYVQGLIHNERISDPLKLLPEAVRETPEVAQAHVRWLMDRGEPGEWWPAAIAAHGAHPDCLALQEAHASALLDRVSGQTGLLFGRILSDDESADVETAVQLYAERWKQLYHANGFVSVQHQSVPLNLIFAYRLQGRLDTAVAVGEQALESFPGDPLVMERVAAAFIEAGENDRASALVSQLEVNRHTAMMRLDLALSSKDWDDVAELVEAHLEVFPANEQAAARAAKIVADAARARQEHRRDILVDGQELVAGDARALMFMAQSARLSGFEDLASDLFGAGMRAFEDGDDGFASRATIAREAMARRAPGIAADMLDGRVDLRQDSDELRLLARAHVFESPIRQRAVAFFDALPATVSRLPAFQSLEGMFHINRGAPQDAVAPFQTAYHEHPTMDTLVALIKSYLRVGDRDAVAALVQDQGLDGLPGPAMDRMDFCHALLDFGAGARALELGYAVLVDNLDQAEVVMKFFGLLLKPTPHRPDIHDCVIAPGMWVRLTPCHGAPFEALIGEDVDRSWGDKADPSNLFVAKFLGLKCGDKVEHENTMGEAHTWTVDAVKPRWLQAFQRLGETFAQRFPEATGFGLITLAEGDIEPTLKQVRQQSDAARTRAELYLEKNVPIALAAGDRSGGAITFANYLAAHDMSVKVCLGSEEERSTALEAIRTNERGGALLDSLTAWRAAELDAFDVLEAQLGPLAIPATELDNLKSFAEEQEGHGNGELITLGYHQGQYYREVISPEQLSAHLDTIKQRIATIEAACTVEPVVVPDVLPDEAERLLGVGVGELVAPILLAGDQRVLLCEDMWMRHAGMRIFGLKSAWLQVALLSAVDAKTMSVDAYSDALVVLAACRHDYVAVGPRELCSVYNRDESRGLDRLKVLCRSIGTENAEPTSHLSAAAAFTNGIWSESGQPDSKKQTATSHVLRALLTRHRGEQVKAWAHQLGLRLNARPREYLERWWHGHFLSWDSETSEAERPSPPIRKPSKRKRSRNQKRSRKAKRR